MQTQMMREALSTPQLIAAQFQLNAPILKVLAERLKSKPPRFAMTVARGSSDHAALFAKYLLEISCGLVTASAAPSVATLYEADLNLQDALVLGLSQSGKSPDLIAMFQVARDKGALTVALVNDVHSPLAEVADFVLPLHAGTETAVAATKSYLATLSALLQLVAVWKQDEVLLQALTKLPEYLKKASEMDWSSVLPIYQQQTNTIVVGRGFSYPIAAEAALKFKEAAVIHAEAFSGAELLHGPFALVQPEFPLFLFAQNDAALKGQLALAERLLSLKAEVILAAPSDIQCDLPLMRLDLPASLHPACDPLCGIIAFYKMIALLAEARGLNPDQPHHLSKVTQTW